jgi:hypothetical protein
MCDTLEVYLVAFEYDYLFEGFQGGVHELRCGGLIGPLTEFPATTLTMGAGSAAEPNSARLDLEKAHLMENTFTNCDGDSLSDEQA